MLITPANAQFNLQVLLSAGIPRNNTVGDPGAQGPGIVGVQGMGVRTPSAAAVADATAGFASEVHMMNGGMFTNGILSMMFALGGPSLSTLGEATESVEGPVPNVHCIIAPIHTSCAMRFPRKISDLRNWF